MGKNSLLADSSDADQLRKYARDLAEVYKSEKQKRKELDAANQQLTKYADDLNSAILKLKAANQELQEAYLDTIHRLVLAAEYKDEDTGDHIIRMSRYAALIAEKLGLPDRDVQNILYAAPMHDIGKIGIPDSILMKPGKLTDEEFDTIKTHTAMGARILANSRAKLLKIAEQIAISHHEKWNGKGYPQGLSGDEIPMVGRIVGLADVFDALTSKRPYKDPFPVEVAIDIIKKERGQHFDPDVVDAFLKNINEILKIKSEVASAEHTSLSDCNYSGSQFSSSRFNS
ncbi:MAG: HD domain-containing protein [Syntrophobacterales bacterium]|nr:HD domain-containing protein [Syntrophobacterales bacterium]